MTGRSSGSTMQVVAPGIITRRGLELSGSAFYSNQIVLAQILQSLLSSLKCAGRHKWLSTGNF